MDENSTNWRMSTRGLRSVARTTHGLVPRRRRRKRGEQVSSSSSGGSNNSSSDSLSSGAARRRSREARRRSRDAARARAQRERLREEQAEAAREEQLRAGRQRFVAMQCRLAGTLTTHWRVCPPTGSSWRHHSDVRKSAASQAMWTAVHEAHNHHDARAGCGRGQWSGGAQPC